MYLSRKDPDPLKIDEAYNSFEPSAKKDTEIQQIYESQKLENVSKAG